jgi:hypothetical protein
MSLDCSWIGYCVCICRGTCLILVPSGKHRAVIGSQFVHLIHRSAQLTDFIAKFQYLRSVLACQAAGPSIGQLRAQSRVESGEVSESARLIAERVTGLVQPKLSAVRDSKRCDDTREKDGRKYRSFH